MFAEVRLRTGSSYSGITFLHNALGLVFDSKNADTGSITFNLPLADALNYGVTTNSIIEVQPNATAAPNMWFGVTSTASSQTVDGPPLVTVQGSSLINWLNDGIVYPSTWHYQITPSDYTVSTNGTRTSVVPRYYTTISSTVTFTANGNIVTTPAANGLAIGDTVQFASVSGVSAIVANQPYYVLTNPTTTTFTLSATVGGSQVTFGSNGSGTNLSKTTSAGDTSQATINGHSFQNATPGTILRTLVARCVQRGGLLWLDVSNFTGTTATSNNPWTSTLTTTYATGQTIQQVLQDLSDRDLIEYHLNGNALKVYNLGESATYWTPDQITFRRGKIITEQTRTLDTSNTIDTVLMAGDALAIGEVNDSSVTPTIGRRRERYVTQGGITDIPTLVTLMGGAELTINGHILTEDSLGIADNSILPWINFQVGDWVWADFDGTLKNIQIQQISASQTNANNLQIALTLGDIIAVQEAKAQRLLDNITGGSGTSYGALPNKTTGKPPSAPTTVVATATPYRDSNGRDQDQVTVNWVTPTTNVDNTALVDLNRLELQFQLGGSSIWTDSANIPATNAILAGFISALAPGLSFVARVRAVNNSGYASNWASSNTIAVLPKVVVTPVTPSTPTTAAVIGGMTVGWNGLDVNSNPMDATFAMANVYVSQSNTFTPSTSTLVGSFASNGGTLTASGLSYSNTYYAKLVIVDKSGNMSVASAASGAVTPLQVGSADIGSNSITTQMIQASAITGAKIAASTIPSSAVNFTARTIGGNTTFTQSTTPTGAITNDLWIDTGNGNVVKTFNGSSWVVNNLSTTQLSGTITAAQIAANTITSNQIAANTITSAQIAASTITAGNIASGTITTNQIAANTITGNNLAVNTITTNNLTVSAFGDSVAPNGSFEDATTQLAVDTSGAAGWLFVNWPGSASTSTSSYVTASPTSAASGAAYVNVNLASGVNGAGVMTTTPVPTSQGDVWFVSFRVMATTAATSLVSAVASFGSSIPEALTLNHTAQGTNTYFATVETQANGTVANTSALGVSTAWVNYEVAVTVPTNTSGNPFKYMALYIGVPLVGSRTANAISFDTVNLRPVNGSASITQLSAAKITSGVISAATLTMGNNGIISIGTTGSSGSIQISTAGIVAYGLGPNNSIIQTVNLSSVDGSFTLAGAGLTNTNITKASIGSSYILNSIITDSGILMPPGSPGYVAAYANGSQITQTYNSSTTWTAPAGVTQVKIQAWGGGGAGSFIPGSQSMAAGGGGGGEYAQENVVNVTAGTTYNIIVGAGGSGGSANVAGGNGGATSFAGDTLIVTANGGMGANGVGYGTGGSGSNNSVHFNGGAGGSGNGNPVTVWGGGGGSSAGTASTGNNGASNSSANSARPGGAAPSGGGAGGASAVAGSAPGGGSGGQSSTYGSTSSPPGAAGRMILTYGGALVNVASLASTAGTDINGVSYPAGLRVTQAGGGYDQSWNYMTLTGGFSNAGGGYTSCRYYKDALGFVHIDGLIVAPNNTSYSGSTFFTLPAGYRPAGAIRAAITNVAASIVASVTISVTGGMTVTTSTQNANVQYSIMIPTFLAEN